MCRGPTNHYCKAAKCYKNAHKRVISGDRSPLTGFLSFAGPPPPGNLPDEERGARVSAAPGERAGPGRGPTSAASLGRGAALQHERPVRLPAPRVWQGRGWRRRSSCPGTPPLSDFLHGAMAAMFWARCFPRVWLCRCDPDSSLTSQRQLRGSPRLTQSLSLLQDGLARRPPLPRRAMRRVEAAPGH